MFQKDFVLILVLMEDTLRGYTGAAEKRQRSVLILVLMEDTLRAVSSILSLETWVS